MFPRISMTLALAAVSASAVRGQSHSEVDSLIAEFLVHGHSASWTPSRLFVGCPRLEPWQEYGIRRLASTELTALQEKDLAISWTTVLHRCDDPRLEQWFMDHVDAAIQRGDFKRRDWLWTGLRAADSPRIRQYLANLMTDANRPGRARAMAWSLYFERLSTDEKLTLFLETFEMPQRFPLNAGIGAALGPVGARPPGVDARGGRARALQCCSRRTAGIRPDRAGLPRLYGRGHATGARRSTRGGIGQCTRDHWAEAATTRSVGEALERAGPLKEVVTSEHLSLRSQGDGVWDEGCGSGDRVGSGGPRAACQGVSRAQSW